MILNRPARSGMTSDAASDLVWAAVGFIVPDSTLDAKEAVLLEDCLVAILSLTFSLIGHIYGCALIVRRANMWSSVSVLWSPIQGRYLPFHGLV